MTLSFTKWVSQGNDFLLAAHPKGRLPSPEFSQRLCHRRLGPGADGLLFYQCFDNHTEVCLINADGSPAEFSGNGFACLTAHLQTDQNILSQDRLYPTEFSTGQVRLLLQHAQTDRQITKTLQEALPSRTSLGIDVGNPHAVCFDKLEKSQVESIALNHQYFPDGVNFSLVQARNHQVQMEVFERGAGWTPSCSSAALAVAHAIFSQTGVTAFEIQQPGGNSHVTRKDGIWMMQLNPIRVADITYLGPVQS